MEEFLLGFLLPVSIVVVLPVSILWIISRVNMAKFERKIAFFEKCIERGVEIDPKILGEERSKKGSLKIKMLNRLMSGVMMLLLGIGLLVWTLVFSMDSRFIFVSLAPFAFGIGLLVWYFEGKKILAEEIKAESAHQTEDK